MAVEKIQIKDMDGNVLFEYECEGNTLKRTVEVAVSQNANLENANLRYAKNTPYVPIWCPSDGPFIGWKKVGSCLVKLLIPDDAERCSASTRKCRCSKALVVSILDLNTNDDVQEITNKAYTPEVIYKVGEMVLPDAFDKDRWNESSNGIHFFINKQDAIDYNG